MSAECHLLTGDQPPPSATKHSLAPPNFLAQRAPGVTTDIEACRAAQNCEVYQTASGGVSIRFKPGTAPGSHPTPLPPPTLARRFAALFRRGAYIKAPDWLYKAREKSAAAGVETRVTIGKTSVNFGKVGASGAKGAYSRLYDVCGQYGCDGGAPVSIKTRSAGSTNAYDYTLELRAEGDFNGKAERDAFIEAVIAAAKEGEKCGERQWSNGGGYLQLPRRGSEWVCDQSNFFAVSRWQGNNLQGYLRATVEVKEKDDKWCAVVNGVLGGISSAISAVPGGAAAGVAAGFFGVVTAVCEAAS
jgi:hypothetical protein